MGRIFFLQHQYCSNFVNTTLTYGNDTIDGEAIQIFLEAWKFGQAFVEHLDIDEDSLFNKVAGDLNVDMRNYWRPDEAFLKRRNQLQLSAIIHDAGCSHKFGSGYKKSW